MAHILVVEALALPQRLPHFNSLKPAPRSEVQLNAQATGYDDSPCEKWTGVPEHDKDAEAPMKCGVLWYLHIPKTGGTTIMHHFHDLHERYRICDAADAELADAWRAELADEVRLTRGLRTVHLLTGRLVPHWLEIFDRLQQHYNTSTPSLQLIQAPIAPGSSLVDQTHLVGLQVPTTMKFNDNV